MDNQDTVTGQRDMILVPRNPTKAMLEAAVDSAQDEKANLVWKDMIEAWESSIEHGEVG